jgi:DNA polymerase III psi subunit
VVLHTRVDLPGDAPARRSETGSTAPAQTPPTVIRPATPLISQKVLILVDEDLLPSDLLFLEKILKAVNLDVDGVDLLNVHGTKNVNFSELLAGKYIHHFFTFGVPFSRLNLDIMMDRYQPVRFEGITFLMADPLPAIEADVALKKKLWESLKKIFLWR